MDFKVKGISWVGNVYQKFESMCLEVEDVVCQETAKYVENQVQTVGSGVKKFYSEVMQDLLPTPPLDLKKPEDSGLVMEEYASFGTYEKPKTSVLEDLSKKDSSISDISKINIHAVKSLSQEQSVDVCKRSKSGNAKYPTNKTLFQIDMSDIMSPSEKKLRQESLRSKVQNEHRLISSLTVNSVTAVDSRLPPESVKSVVAANSKLPPEQNTNKEMHKNPHILMGTVPVDQNLPLLETQKLVSPAGQGISGTSSDNNILKGDLTRPCDTEIVMTRPMPFNISVCNEHKMTGTSGSNRVIESGCGGDSSSIIQSSSLPLSVVSCEINAVENGLSTINDISTELNGVETVETSFSLPLKESSWSEPLQFSEVVTEESDENHLELHEGDDIIELPPEAMDDFSNAKLEESCIVVDRKELFFVPHQAGKHRSYKKKIRDALASRMRLAKKQEYEQLAIWHRGPNNLQTIERSSPSLLTNDLKESLSHDNGESEWELL